MQSLVSTCNCLNSTTSNLIEGGAILRSFCTLVFMSLIYQQQLLKTILYYRLRSLTHHSLKIKNCYKYPSEFSQSSLKQHKKKCVLCFISITKRIDGSFLVRIILCYLNNFLNRADLYGDQVKPISSFQVHKHIKHLNYCLSFIKKSLLSKVSNDVCLFAGLL